jgi:hypothetical protein
VLTCAFAVVWKPRYCHLSAMLVLWNVASCDMSQLASLWRRYYLDGQSCRWACSELWLVSIRGLTGSITNCKQHALCSVTCRHSRLIVTETELKSLEDKSKSCTVFVRLSDAQVLCALHDFLLFGNVGHERRTDPCGLLTLLNAIHPITGYRVIAVTYFLYRTYNGNIFEAGKWYRILK